MTDVQHGKYTQFIAEAVSDESDHFEFCPACGGWIDCRDLGVVFEHAGPLPHPAGERPIKRSGP